ncbi:hypothetical protein [Actinokineospora globicatena]|uniref:hypothetical protein n=1 Tax=Actinokineospora globicatena TaxID=103729 RepID=UPI0020A36200|nr:hypothetical protein [Actinokineospora globicatena]MCP2303787.1 hypothetical protein [Actinokineospora globicatena]GLW79061.1 hypothetical protein Aglo01_35430 [Actinokineospora globicatena]GLW86529.1 hypothetical protein Aglo02_41680 [Actinokineospora globicatena]
MTPERALSTDLDAAAIAAAVSVLPQVAGPHSGRYGEIATYLPGRRIEGVRVRPEEIAVGVVARYPATVDEVDSAVRAAVLLVVGPDRPPPWVWIGDVALPRTTVWLAAAPRPPERPLPGAGAPGTAARTTA